MKKTLLITLALLLLASTGHAYTCTATKAGNWNDTSVWTGSCNSTYPQAGDAVVLAGYVVAMNVARIPASGSLASINGATTSSQITVDMSATGINGNATIDCGTGNITGGGVSGTIITTVASTNTLTITGNLVFSGSTANRSVLRVSTTGNNPSIVINGNVTGGAGSYAIGIYIYNGTYSGSITVNGNVTGGSAANAAGIEGGSDVTGTIALTGNIVDGSAAPAIYWPSTVTWTPGNTYYHQTSSGVTLYNDTDPGIANVKSGTTYYYKSGTIKTGTLAGGGGAWAN